MIKKIEMPDEMKGRQVLLYGAGRLCYRYYDFCRSLNIYPSHVVDMDSGKRGKYIGDLEVISLDDLRKFPKDTPIIIATRFIESVETTLNSLGYCNVWAFSDMAYSEYHVDGIAERIKFQEGIPKKSVK